MPNSSDDQPTRYKSVTVLINEKDLPSSRGTAARKRNERDRKKDRGLIRCEAYLTEPGAELFRKISAADRHLTSQVAPGDYDKVRTDLISATQLYATQFAMPGHTKINTNSETCIAPGPATGHIPNSEQFLSSAKQRVTGHADNDQERRSARVKLTQEPKPVPQEIPVRRITWPVRIAWYGLAYNGLTGWRKSFACSLVTQGLVDMPIGTLAPNLPIEVKDGMQIACLSWPRRTAVVLLMIFGW